MKKYFLTNTTKVFISLLDKRNIRYHLKEDRKGGLYIWLPSDQDLFMLAQDYEQERSN